MFQSLIIKTNLVGREEVRDTSLHCPKAKRQDFHNLKKSYKSLHLGNKNFTSQKAQKDQLVKQLSRIVCMASNLNV